MSLPAFFEWLENTGGSVAIRESILFYPLVETTHVLTLCLFLGMTATWDLRLVGLTFRKIPVSLLASNCFVKRWEPPISALIPRITA